MAKKKYSSAIVTGSVSWDIIMDFPSRFIDHLDPNKLHQINVSFVVDNLEKQIGGTGTNIAYNLNLKSQISDVKTILLASVGKDGKEMLNFFRKNNIETKGILIDKTKYSATGTVITDIKDNQIWGFYYGACEKAKGIDLKKFADKNSLMIISANHPKAFLNFQRQAIKVGIDYIYDPGMTLTWIKDEDLKEGVFHAKWLVGNDYEIAQILKRMNVSIYRLIDTGISVITTLGEEGVKYEEKVHQVYKVKSYKVKRVVDPTGAGDAWRGGFMAGILEQKPLIECLKLGNVMASFAIEKYGTVNHRPTGKEIEERVTSL